MSKDKDEQVQPSDVATDELTDEVMASVAGGYTITAEQPSFVRRNPLSLDVWEHA